MVLLTGARQTGKTSLLRRVFDRHSYVTLDLPSDAAQAESSPETFFAAHPPPVLVDEVQYSPGLFRHVKARVDQRRAPGQVVLTGSQQLPLMRQVSDSLAGRVALFAREGPSAAELAATGADSELLRLLCAGSIRSYGGIPICRTPSTIAPISPPRSSATSVRS